MAAESFGADVAFVSLGSISDPELVAPTIAQAFGIQDLGGHPLLERLNEVGEVARQAETLVYIGSIAANRGVYQLLEIVTRLRSRIQGIRLLLIGPFTGWASPWCGLQGDSPEREIR